MDVDTLLVKHNVQPSMVSCCSERCPHKIRHRSWQGQVYTTVTFDAVSARNGVPLPATFPTYFLSQELDAVVFCGQLGERVWSAHAVRHFMVPHSVFPRPHIHLPDGRQSPNLHQHKQELRSGWHRQNGAHYGTVEATCNGSAYQARVAS